MKFTEDLIPRVFFDALSPKLKLLFEEVLEEGFRLTMVGGATRDFLLYGRVSKDIDLEIRSEIHLEEEEWKKLIISLGQKLKAHYPVEFLPFGILRVEVGNSIVEFSSPRVEKYSEQGPWGHSDFLATLSPVFVVEDSFKRRDFTINAIGFQFSDLLDLKIKDPFRGIEDLKAGILRPCSEDFFKDPVRFLRLLRFAKKFKYRLAPSLEVQLHYFDLSKLKPFHFCQEAFKGGFTSFLEDFYSVIKEKSIPCPNELQFFQEFLSDGFQNNECDQYRTMFVAKVFHGDSKTSPHALLELSERLGMKQHFLNQLYEFKSVLVQLDEIEWKKEIKRILEIKIIEEILNDKVLILFERFYFYEKRLQLNQACFAQCLPEKMHKLVCELLDFFPEHLLGEKDFLNSLRDQHLPKEQFAVWRIYNHLKRAVIA